MFIRVL